MANDNPSVVNDASGSNYNISSGGSMGDAQMQYLDNLQRLAMKAPPKPLSPDQYMPGEERGIQRGTYSSRETGSVPLFAASNLIPFAMMDEMRRSVAEEEVKYYATLKTELDKPLIGKNIHLDNPAAQPAFWNKFQGDVDGMLAESTNRQGGNAMLGQISLAHDRKFLQYVNGVDQYAKMYNDVYAKAKDVKDKLKEPSKWFVSKEQEANLNKFLTTQDLFSESPEKMSMDKLVKSSIDFGAKESIFALADAATKGIQESITEEYPKLSTMSTDEMNVYISKKTTGYEKQADEITDALLTSNDYGSEGNSLLRKEVKARVQYGTTYSTDQFKKANADRDLELKRFGVETNEQGITQFATRPSALTGNIGINAINYPVDKNNLIPTIAGMQVLVRDVSGSVKRVTLPGSYMMMPISEYDLVDKGMAVERGRYIEGRANIQGTEPYTPDNERALTSKGQLVGTYSLGEGRTTTQVNYVIAEDDKGNPVKLFGETIILVPFDSMKGQVEASIGATDAIKYAHKKLDDMTYSNGARRNFDPSGNATKEGSKVIIPPDDAERSYFKDDPNIIYNWGGAQVSGSYLNEQFRLQDKQAAAAKKIKK